MMEDVNCNIDPQNLDTLNYQKAGRHNNPTGTEIDIHGIKIGGTIFYVQINFHFRVTTNQKHSDKV